MSNLIKIAKDCGAMYVPPTIRTGQIIVKDQLTFTEEQLQATVEQVCKPLLAALLDFDSNSHIQDVGAADFCATTCEAKEMAQKAISGYHELMGTL